MSKLYVGQQTALHKDVVDIHGFFYSLVVHIDTAAPAQALMREISGGGREFPPGLTALFRRYRTRIPPLPGLWRISVLQQLSEEEALPPDAEMDDLEANENAPQTHGQKQGQPSLVDAIRTNLVVVLLAVPPFFMVVVGAKRVGSEGSCDQPVGTVILLDGLLLFCAGLGVGGFEVNRRRFTAWAGTWLFPIAFLSFVAHVALVVSLLVSVARVEFVGSLDEDEDEDEDDGRTACSLGTFAWGVVFLVVHLFCLVAPPAVMCVRCWERVTSSDPAFVIPEERYRDRHGDDGGSNKNTAALTGAGAAAEKAGAKTAGVQT